VSDEIKGTEVVEFEDLGRAIAEMGQERYLGDGVYASFDGYQIKLRTNRTPRGVDDEIYFDPSTLLAFEGYVKQLKEKYAHAVSIKEALAKAK
jgi:hypothetical protein